MKSLFSVFLLCISLFLQAQNPKFTHADTLMGSLSPLRTCYDVKEYQLEVRLDIPSEQIAGTNKIIFEAKQSFSDFQIDLHPTLDIYRITWKGQNLTYAREYGAVFVHFPQEVAVGTKDTISVIYHGKPPVAVNPPWDGGLVWKKDEKQKPWIGVACEGEGASMWWPCKDHLSDEPDSMKISVIVPKGLKGIANGKFKGEKSLQNGELSRFDWQVSYPINPYNVSFYIGDYVQIKDSFESVGGKLSLDYYVLSYNEEKAKKHFKQVKEMLTCFEHYFGEYPFRKDGYKLVESSYWGMEHQSAIAYGNHYLNNEYKFDFIIVHESGHEWFGNSLSMQDKVDMWIHEAFTTYTEALYVEYYQGKEKAQEYLDEQKNSIRNRHRILGYEGVKYDGWPDADMYYKGTWMLHTLRNAVNDDKKWFKALKTYTQTFKISPVTTAETINFFNQQLGADYTWLFNEYLKYTEIPTLEWQVRKQGKTNILAFRWKAEEADFSLPVEVHFGKEKKIIYPSTEWQEMLSKVGADDILFNDSKGLFSVEIVEED